LPDGAPSFGLGFGLRLGVGFEQRSRVLEVAWVDDDLVRPRRGEVLERRIDRVGLAVAAREEPNSVT
jgi:hypothetical protein